jgi:hypothetical protein
MRSLLPTALLLAAAGSASAGDNFEVKPAGAAGAVGEQLTASVTITAKQGWHLNHEAPLSLKLAPPPGVVVAKPRLGREDLAVAGETQARFDVGLTLAEPGRKVIAAEAGFVLCRADACQPIKEKLSLTAEASPAKAAPRKRPSKQK